VSAGERVVKWVKRRPAVAALLGLVMLLTAAGLAGIAWAYGRGGREAGNARRGGAHCRGQVQATERAPANTKGGPADALWREGQVGLAHDRLEEVPEELRRWEWHCLKRTTAGGLFTLDGHATAVTSVCFSPDGNRFASASGNLEMEGDKIKE